MVNLITKTDFNGFQLDAFGNVPTHAGGEQFSVSALWGKTFDRGHIMVALDYFKQNELARGDRKYLGCPEAYFFNHNGGGRADVIDPRTGKFHCEDLPVGQVWTYDFEYNYFDGRPGNLNIPGIPKADMWGRSIWSNISRATPWRAADFSGCGDRFLLRCASGLVADGLRSAVATVAGRL